MKLSVGLAEPSPGSGGDLVGEREVSVLDGTDAVAEVELGAGSSGLVGTLVVAVGLR